jgi:hypothetical protein
VYKFSERLRSDSHGRARRKSGQLARYSKSLRQHSNKKRNEPRLMISRKPVEAVTKRRLEGAVCMGRHDCPS